jgi:phosphoribosyl-AMP cyclohydrolase / phosphoribosyl-ATP pyrophosphohydrolase
VSEVAAAAAAADVPAAPGLASDRRSTPAAAPEVRYGADGLVPAVVQDAADGRVLMLAWMDAEALTATVETGEVHFHSRSRDRLWRKGETSGNILRLVDLAVDCDGDALLVTADPVGPTCHRGTGSCFDPAAAARDATAAAAEPPAATTTAESLAAPAGDATQGFAWLETLWSTIAARAAERPSGSYTTSLLDGGVDAVGRKVTEEATELLLAAKDDATATTPATREALAAEAADLLYHALVLLAERDLPPAVVISTLRARHAR